MYLEIDEDFPTHPKTLRLSARLGNPTAGLYMLRLWSWARKFQKDGDISSYEPGEIELAAGWPALDGKFYEAACVAGFIDREREGQPVRRALHNWMKRTGGAIQRMEAEADRKKKYRAHRAKPRQCGGVTAGCEFCVAEGDEGRQLDIQPAVSGRTRDDPGRVRGPSADETDQDKTRQGKTSQDPDPLAPISRLPDRARSEDRAEGDPEVWPAGWWLTKYKAAWERSTTTNGVRVFYADTGDSKACGVLAGELEKLPRDVRLTAQARAPAMFTAFFASSDRRTVERKYPFCFFVQEFGALRNHGVETVRPSRYAELPG